MKANKIKYFEQKKKFNWLTGWHENDNHAQKSKNDNEQSVPKSIKIRIGLT